ncbi:hypothetical protein GCM10018785_44980 [Streptomyces longispororuber]|uniref:Uncharacterized protein n=1 Tax=Streptomyces longispororuber TaxID=68230 RepID=A0A918ZV60_9ACTN|nr:hypothetical protein [Streptomyces longispororuber]GHE71737.1 hypothetical protein GCM10018785_44980 [Streptomyces longispororuber]
MVRSVRWLVAVAAAVVTFVVCLWGARLVVWGWLPAGDAERWGVAAAFAAVAAGAVGMAVGWWAGREPPAEEREGGGSVEGEATGHGWVDQVRGHRGGPGGAVPDDLRLNAKASEYGQVRQTGGDDHTGGGRGSR